METVRLPLTKTQAKAALRQIPAILAGKQPDRTGHAQGILHALGIEALSIVKQAFITKSRGGTDEAGIKWQPLSARYLAYGRRHPGLKRDASNRRPLLTADQDKLWRQVFARTWRGFTAKGMDDKDAQGQAASHAWVVVKAAGGKTLLGKYGDAPHEIGRDTGRGFNSLSPGSNSPDQILRTEPGAVTVGTNVAYMAHFHAKRPLWPSSDRVPKAWTDRLGEVLADGIRLMVKALLRGGR
jgi:hypothetical protein